MKEIMKLYTSHLKFRTFLLIKLKLSLANFLDDLGWTQSNGPLFFIIKIEGNWNKSTWNRIDWDIIFYSKN